MEKVLLDVKEQEENTGKQGSYPEEFQGNSKILGVTVSRIHSGITSSWIRN